MRARTLLPLLLGLVGAVPIADPAHAGRRRGPPVPVTHEAVGRQTWTSPQSNPVAVSPDGTWVAVAATTSNEVQIFSTAGVLATTTPVGMEPVSVVFKSDGSELWVSNHVSDSVSVIDMDTGSASFLRVVETIQDVDADGATLFDEPVGIAFKGDGSQAYVTLSSRDAVAIVDTSTYEVTGRLHVSAQDPRALVVARAGPSPSDPELLIVASFESGNRSQLSACEDLADDSHCTLDLNDLLDFAIQNPNLPGHVKDIVFDDEMPDRDLFVWDTSTLADGAAPDQTVSGVGTLLYGLAVDGDGVAWVTQTDARNVANGADGMNLVEMDNRIFLNRITRVSCAGGACGAPSFIDLEPFMELDQPAASPQQPAAGDALATPYGIAVTGDGILVISAAASSRIATVDPDTGAVLARLDVGAIPRGVALLDNGDGTHTAYVVNTLGNSLSLVTVGTPGTGGGALAHVTDATVGHDPTPGDVRLGNIAFNDANASTSGTFACASCHPDGNVDQLIWRIGGAMLCTGPNDPPGCETDEPRTTMPVRGLRDTLPLHWDGTLGDPFGGGNGALPGSSSAASCDGSDPQACFRHLVEGSLSGVMCDQTGGCPSCDTSQNPPVCPGGALLGNSERTDMAIFLESVSYPPARSRRASDQISPAARNGFEDFFMDNVNGVFGTPVSNLLANDPETCADSTAGCHEFPQGTATNSVTLGDFDAPTMRGMTDRFLQFSLGLTHTEEMLVGMNDGFDVSAFAGLPPGSAFSLSQPFGIWTTDVGPQETFTFGVAYSLFDLVYGGSALSIFQMFEEASTGHSGALGRQVTLNTVTSAACIPAGTGACPLEEVLAALEAADGRGTLNLRGNGLRLGANLTISYEPETDATAPYKVGSLRRSRAGLVSEAQTGTLLATLTGHLRAGVTESTPQPLLSVRGANCGTPAGAGTTRPTGSSTVDPALPRLTGSATTISILETKYVTTVDQVFVDGAPWPGASITSVTAGGATTCADTFAPDATVVNLGSQPLGGTHLLQIRSGGLLSNELPFCVTACNL